MIKINSISNPRQVVLVTCREEITVLGKKQSKDNIITLSWHTPVSFEPLLYAIVIGKTSLSNEIISKAGCFCINFIPPELEKEAVYCGRHSGKHLDKFAKTNLTKEECEAIDCPRIGEASAFMECEIAQEVEVGDHIIYVGKVSKMGGQPGGKRLFQVEGDEFTTTR